MTKEEQVMQTLGSIGCAHDDIDVTTYGDQLAMFKCLKCGRTRGEPFEPEYIRQNYLRTLMK